MTDVPLRCIDTHCHLDLYPDYADVLGQCEEAGIYTIAVTNTPSVFRQTVELTHGARFVRAALGLHPELAREREQELALFNELLPETRYVGEVGLDYVTEDAADRAAQRRVFDAVLNACATVGDKVLTIHSRRAAADVVAMIGDAFPGVVILHWFSGSKVVLDQAIAHGCYFSINPAMLGSASGVRTIAALPRDRVLTETDGPFVIVRGRSARPIDVSDLLVQLARLWNLDRAETSQRIYDNFRQMLTIQ